LGTHKVATLSEEEISKIDFADVPDDSGICYAVECDLEYPSELHETHNDYPLAPEHVMVTEAMLSPFCKSMNVKYAFTEKLIGDLHPMIKYKTHCRNLKLYLSLGMKLLLAFIGSWRSDQDRGLNHTSNSIRRCAKGKD
jgi:hypothetical protein